MFYCDEGWPFDAKLFPLLWLFPILVADEHNPGMISKSMIQCKGEWLFASLYVQNEIPIIYVMPDFSLLLSILVIPSNYLICK